MILSGAGFIKFRDAEDRSAAFAFRCERLECRFRRASFDGGHFASLLFGMDRLLDTLTGCFFFDAIEILLNSLKPFFFFLLLAIFVLPVSPLLLITSSFIPPPPIPFLPPNRKGDEKQRITQGTPLLLITSSFIPPPPIPFITRSGKRDKYRRFIQ